MNPASDTVTVYVPADKAGTENAPVVLVTTSYFVSVALLLTTTLAPGMTPPAVSVTTPEMAEVAAALRVGGGGRQADRKRNRHQPMDDESHTVSPPVECGE